MNYQTPIRSEVSEAYRPDVSQFETTSVGSRKKWVWIGIAIMFAGALAFWFLTKGGENGAVGAGDDASSGDAAATAAASTPRAGGARQQEQDTADGSRLL